MAVTIDVDLEPLRLLSPHKVDVGVDIGGVREIVLHVELHDEAGGA